LSQGRMENNLILFCSNGVAIYRCGFSAGFRTYEALCYLSYEAPYLGPEGGRPGRPTQAVGHTCSGQLGIVKILRYIRSDIASSTN